MTRGRKAGSEMRDRIYALIARHQPAYGYELYKRYIAKYEPITLRVVYYHLKYLQENGKIRLKEVVGTRNKVKKLYTVCEGDDDE